MWTMRPDAIGSVTAGPNRSRRRRRHRHRPGRGRNVSPAACPRALVGGAGTRYRPTRTWRDIGAAARTQSWFWPGTRARRHRHGRRSRAGVKPLQFLSIKLVGHVVGGRCRGRPSADTGHPSRSGFSRMRRTLRPMAPSGRHMSPCLTSRWWGRDRSRGRRPGSLRLRQGRRRDRQSCSNGNAVQDMLHATILRWWVHWTVHYDAAEPDWHHSDMQRHHCLSIP